MQLPEFLNNAAPDLSDHVLDESDSVLEELEVNTTSGKVSSDSAILKKLPDLSILASARIKGEIRKIREVLKNAGNNRTQTARELGISRVALYKKLHKYGLIEIP